MISIKVDDIKRLSVAENEILVVQIDASLPPSQAQRMCDTIGECLEDAFPNPPKLMVVPSTVSFLKISGQDAAILKLKGVDNSDK